MSEKTTNITEEELNAVRAAQSSMEVAKLNAEKSVALSKLAEVEVNNIILTIFNKHGLKAGEDQILPSGAIVRAEDVKKAEAASDDSPDEVEDK